MLRFRWLGNANVLGFVGGGFEFEGEECWTLIIVG